MADFNLGTARGRIEIDASGAQSGADDAKKAVAGLQGGLDNAAGSLLRTGSVLTGIGGVAVAGFGVAINAAANFEERISAIGAVSNATGEEMDAARKKALQLGADTKFSAAEAATAMENLVKGGLSLTDVLGGAADATVALAAATDTDLAVAAEVAATAMASFNLEAKDMTSVADTITGSVNSFVRSTDEFRLALSQSGAVADQVGLSFDDLSLGITAMAKNGIHGSDAGTSLKTMLLNLQPTTTKQTDLFKELGLVTDETGGKLTRLGGQVLTEDDIFQRFVGSGDKVKKKLAEVGIEVNETAGWFTDAAGNMLDFGAVTETLAGKANLSTKELQAMGLEVSKGGNQFFDASGKIKSMSEIAGVLQKSLEGMTDQQKLANLEILFGTDAIRAAAILAEEGAAGFDTLAAAIHSTTADETAAKRMDNLKGSLEQLKGSVETAFIKIGQAGQGPVRAIVDFLTKLVNAFTNLPGPVQQFLLMAVLAIGVLTGLAGVFLLVGGSVLKVISVFRQLKSALAIVKTIQALSKATAVLNAVMALNPVVLIVAGIVALGAALILAYKHVEGFRNIVDGAWQLIQKAFHGIIDVGKAVVGFFVDNWQKILLILAPFIAIPLLIIQNWDKISSFFSDLIGKVVGAVTGWVSDMVGKAVDMGARFLNAILDGFGKVLGGIKDKIGEALSFVGEIPGKILEKLGDLGSLLLDAGKRIVEGLINGIKSLAGSVVDALLGLLPGPLKRFAGALGLGSPSKLFEGFGKDTVAGYIMGLEAKQKTLDRAVASMADIAPSAGRAVTLPSNIASVVRGSDGASAPTTFMGGGGGGGASVVNNFNAPLIEVEANGMSASEMEKLVKSLARGEMKDIVSYVVGRSQAKAGSRSL